MGQNPVLFYKVFPNRDKMPLRGPSEGSLLANVTAVTGPKNRDICTFKMTHDSLLKALESDSSSNFHAVDFV